MQILYFPLGTLVVIIQDYVHERVESRFKFRSLRNGRKPTYRKLGQNDQTILIMNEI